ncbi:MAG: IS1634 family transposase [Thermoplasmata archaeon]
MFLRITRVKRSSATLEYASIAERKIEDGKQKTITLKYLGRVKSNDDLERYKRTLDEYRHAMKKISIMDVRVGSTLSFGVFYASNVIMDRRGISAVLEKHMGTYSTILSFMIISRLFKPSSDIDLLDLRERVYYPWKMHLSEDNIYRTLDKLISEKDGIEIDLFKALNPNTSIVHYDMTSSYFEGRENNDLVLFGYSRDKNRGKEQIVIGMVMADGIPIYHQVWRGNTVDPKTLESTISVLKERFHVDKVIFIGDRAFGRNPSLNLLDKGLYITAAYRWDQPYRDVLMGTDFSDGITMDDLVIKEVTIDASKIVDPGTTEKELDFIRKRRYIAVYNKNMEDLDLRDINDKICLVNRKINECPNLSDLKKSLGELRSFVKFTKDGVTLNHIRIEMMKKLAGRFLIITNTDLKEMDAVTSYKEQWKIERAFRTIKTFLEIRPVYHRKSDRIRAHVFVCVLSLLLSRIMEKQTGRTIESITKDLDYLDVVPIQAEDKLVYVSSDSSRASDILKLLGVSYPRILESAHT